MITPYVFDEVQIKKKLFPIIRAAIDKKREASRFILLELTPFHFEEIKSEISYFRKCIYCSFA